MDPGVPICLADKVVLNRPRARDERISMADIAYDPRRIDFVLYQKVLGLTDKAERGKV